MKRKKRKTDEQRREAKQLKANVAQGKAAEAAVAAKYKRMGCRVEKMHKGADLKVTYPNGRVRYVEVKSGPARHVEGGHGHAKYPYLRKAQGKMKDKKKGRYKVVRV